MKVAFHIILLHYISDSSNTNPKYLNSQICFSCLLSTLTSYTDPSSLPNIITLFCIYIHFYNLILHVYIKNTSNHYLDALLVYHIPDMYRTDEVLSFLCFPLKISTLFSSVPFLLFSLMIFNSLLLT